MKKYLLILTFALLSNSLQASNVRSLMLEKVVDSNNVLVKYSVTVYIYNNDGVYVQKDLKTGAQLLKLTKILNPNNYANKVSKAPGRAWIIWAPDGTLDRVVHHALSNFEEAINRIDDIDPATVTDIAALKTYLEGLIP